MARIPAPVAGALALFALCAPAAMATPSETFSIGSPAIGPAQDITLTENSTFVLGQDPPFVDLGDVLFSRDFPPDLSIGSPSLIVNGVNIPLTVQVDQIVDLSTPDSNGYGAPLFDVYYQVVGGDYDFGPLGHIDFSHGPIHMATVYDDPGATGAVEQVGLTLHDIPGQPPTAVPEPAPITGVLLGASALAGLVWRRRRRSSPP